MITPVASFVCAGMPMLAWIVQVVGWCRKPTPRLFGNRSRLGPTRSHSPIKTTHRSFPRKSWPRPSPLASKRGQAALASKSHRAGAIAKQGAIAGKRPGRIQKVATAERSPKPRPIARAKMRLKRHAAAAVAGSPDKRKQLTSPARRSSPPERQMQVRRLGRPLDQPPQLPEKGKWRRAKRRVRMGPMADAMSAAKHTTKPSLKVFPNQIS
jgi:hypothetical protein